jgi:hypothetical protein
MKDFGTKEYTVEALSQKGDHRVIDNRGNYSTPIDRSRESYDILKGAIDVDVRIFNSTCESLINVCGEKHVK